MFQWRSEARTSRPAPGRPEAFGVRDEGAGLRGLYFTRCAPSVLADALVDLEVEAVWSGSLRLPPALVAPLEAPLQITTAPGAHTVLADPHAAVPEDGDLALDLDGSGHAVAYARDPAVLVVLLRSWLSDRLDRAGVATGLDGVGDPAVRALLEPSGRWLTPVLQRGPRLTMLEFRVLVEPGAGRPGALQTRWVGGSAQGWRTDWSW